MSQAHLSPLACCKAILRHERARLLEAQYRLWCARCLYVQCQHEISLLEGAVCTALDCVWWSQINHDIAAALWLKDHEKLHIQFQLIAGVQAR